MSQEPEANLGLAERSTPWFIVTHELLPDLDIEGFAEDRGLDREALAAEVLSGVIENDDTIAALAFETGMSEQFFRNLTWRYQHEMGKRKGPALDPGTYSAQK